MDHRRWGVLVAAGAVVLAACGGTSAPTASGTRAATPAPTASATGAATPAATASATEEETATPGGTETASATGGGGDGESVSIANFEFSPADLTVPVGATVTWTNADSAPHSVAWEGEGPDSDTLQQGDSYQRTFDAAGTFPYVCGIHPQMKASVTVE